MTIARDITETEKAPSMPRLSEKNRRVLVCLGEALPVAARRALVECEPNLPNTRLSPGWMLSFSSLYEPVGLDVLRNNTTTFTPYMDPTYEFSCVTYYMDRDRVSVLAMTKEAFAEEREYTLLGRRKREYIFDDNGKPVMYRYDKAQQDIRRVLISYYKSQGFKWATSVEMGSLINVLSQDTWRDAYRIYYLRFTRVHHHNRRNYKINKGFKELRALLQQPPPVVRNEPDWYPLPLP